jgi:hypothetical protein
VPFTVTTPSAILTSTLSGIFTGTFPIRDMMNS